MSIKIERHYIKPTHNDFKECDLVCYVVKNLLNKSLYIAKEHQATNDGSFYFVKERVDPSTGEFIENKQFIYHYNTLYHLLKDSPEFRTDQHTEYKGRSFNTKMLKHTFISINNAWKSFKAALASWKANPSKFKAKPQMMGFKPKNGRFIATFNYEAVSFKRKSGYIHLASTNIYIKNHNALITKDTLLEVQIIPLSSGYDILITYDTDGKDMRRERKRQAKESKLKGDTIDETVDWLQHPRQAYADLGVNNLLTLSSNDPAVRPTIINGGPVKSINQYMNKVIADLKKALACLPKREGKDGKMHPRGSSHRIRRTFQRRNNKMRDEFHRISHHVVEWLKSHGITALVVGYNEGWKQDINLGRKTNQKFSHIPYRMLLNQLEYKCADAGIVFVANEESYTSKCSFLDMEHVGKHEEYAGKRVKRGLFKSGTGALINADLNGSLNIGRKVVGDGAFASYPIEGFAVSPLKYTVGFA